MGLTLAFIVAASGLSLIAQAPAAPVAPTQQVHADLNQLMRGTLYAAANVVFSAQADDPTAKKWPEFHDPAMSTDPLISTFGGWVAVENAALALAESTNLMAIPGRLCSNGVPVPITDPGWMKFVQDTRDISMQAYKAAQAKSQEQIFKVSETLSTNCSACHRRWRDRRPAADRCKP